MATTPTAPTPTGNGIYDPDPSHKPNFKKARIWLLIILAICAIWAWPRPRPKFAKILPPTCVQQGTCGSDKSAPAPRPEPAKPPKFSPADYSKQFCGGAREKNFKNRDKLTEFKVELSAGCYSAKFILPEDWHDYQIDTSEKEGDWATMWCEGRTEPSAIHPGNESFPPDDFRNCKAFSLQGKGSILFTRLTAW